ncbi:PrgI family protein [Patescibacteria group bacterium]|nr:PrgI family protein [Patescibacteria group bacterium]
MENHPIPQDITGFQFKLIGNMTIKQFAYLAGGVVIGWVTFALPITGIIKFPFTFLFGLSGIALAFLPYEGRPLDVMIGNFFKALFNPTQFVYQKTGGVFYCPPVTARALQQASSQKTETSSLSGENLKKFLDALPKRPKNKLDEKEMVFFQSLAGFSQVSTTPANANPAYVESQAFANKVQEQQPENVTTEPNQNQEVSQVKEEDLEQEEKHLKEELEKAKKEEGSEKNTANYEAAHKKVSELEKLLNDTISQKQDLESQILALHKKLTEEKKDTYRPSLATPEVKEQTKNVRLVPKEMGKKVGLPIASEFPNVIAGIIKDPRNNPLPNVLVEVKDSEGNPVRAFKTNALGQFASATPLTNGTYTIEFDDPKGQSKFDAIEFSASGEVILPIEVISIDSREELRKALFN